MPIVNVLDGSAARAIHVRQILGWLRGVPTNSEPTKFTGITDTDEYAVTVQNNDPTYQKGLRVLNSGGTISVFDVANGKTTLRPATDGSTILSIRNFADSADVFTVTTTGVTFGGANLVTETGTQTLTNKTLTTAILNGAVVNDYLDILRSASAPANPADANTSRLYGLQADSLLRYRNSAGGIETLVAEDEVQTLTNKTLSTPTVSGGVIDDYIDVTRTASAPSNPASANTHRIYALQADDVLHYRSNLGLVKDIVTTIDTQTLTNKTLTSPTLSTPIINTGIVGEYITFNDLVGSAPTVGATQMAIYKKSSNTGIYFKSGNDTERSLADLTTAQTFTNKTLTSPAITSPTISEYTKMLDITGSAPSIGAGEAAIYKNASVTTLAYKAGADTERILVDTAQAQTLTNKTLSAPIVSGGAVFAIGSAPGDPGGSAAVLYHLTGSASVLKYKAGDNTERTIVDTDSAQTLSNKSFSSLSLTGAVLTSAVIDNYMDLAQISSPGAPGALYSRFYAKTDNNVYFHPNGGSETVLLTNANATTVVTNSFARALLTGGL